VSATAAARAGVGESGDCCALALMALHPARTAPRNHRAEWDTATPTTGQREEVPRRDQAVRRRGKLGAVAGSDCKTRISLGLRGVRLSKSQPRAQKAAAWSGKKEKRPRD
jgi:hypothetical protein